MTDRNRFRRRREPFITMPILAAALLGACAAGMPVSVPPSVTSSASSTAIGSSSTAIASATPPATVTAKPDPYAGLPVSKVAAAIIPIPESDVGYLGVTGDAVWAATSSGLVRIDPKTLRLEWLDHTGRFGLATTATVVWSSDFDAGIVSRLDTGKRKLDAVAEMLGNPNAIAIHGDAVWVTRHRGGAVDRLQAKTGKVMAEVDVGPAGASGPQGVAAGANAVWVGIPNIKSVVRIDPTTNAVVATIKTTTSPCGGIAVQPNAVWLSSCFDDRDIVRIDPQTNVNVTEIDLGGHNGGAVVVDGYPWFPVGNRLVRIDPATNRIDRVLEFASGAFHGFGSTLGFGSLWIGGVDGQIARIPIVALAN
jgi:hypothetical protein